MRKMREVGVEVGIVLPTIRQAEIIYEANEIARVGGGHPKAYREVACLYLSVLEEKDPFTLSDLSEASDLDNSGIYRVSEDIRDRLCLTIEPQTPQRFVNRYIDQLNEKYQACLGRETYEVATSLVEQESVRSPVSIAAGAVYVGAQVENKRVTAAQVAQIANIDPRTVRSAADEISEKL